jgi:opacity protein-like surface antigen
MKKLLLAAVAAISLGRAAHAGELVCNVQDTVGNGLTYVFGSNT